MIYFVKELTENDIEFLSVMLLLDKYVKKNKQRVLYIPQYTFYPIIKKQNDNTQKVNTNFDEKELERIFNRFNSTNSRIKLEIFLKNFRGKSTYIPTIHSVYKVLRNYHIKMLLEMGVPYKELEECFNLSNSGLRRIKNSLFDKYSENKIKYII